MSSTAKEDDARKRFLTTLSATLDPRWRAEYERIERFGVIGMRLSCEDVDGFVQVVPSSVLDGLAVSWKPFPGSGQAHYELYFEGKSLRRTCVLADATRMLENWARSKAEVVRSAPVAMLPEMQARLQAIAGTALPAVEDAIGLDAAKLKSLTKVGREQLAAARAALDPGAVARAYPRDDQGRLLLDQQALLAKLDSSARLAQGRALYVIARGPRIRRDGERIELVIADAIAENESHRWLDAPWLWRKRSKRPALAERAGECCALLDAGRFDEALALYGMALEPFAIKVLEGIPLGGHGGEHSEAWQRTLRRALWELAPWQLRGRGFGRMALLPHQIHQVKAWIAWAPDTIGFENTANSGRMPEHLWKRNVDYDLERLAIARAGQRPVKIAKAKPKPARSDKPLADYVQDKTLWQVKTAIVHAKQRPAAAAMQELLALAHGTREGKWGYDRANALFAALAVATAADGPSFAKLLTDGNKYVARMAIEGVKSTGHSDAIPALAGLVNASRDGGDGGLGADACTAMKSLTGVRGASGMIPYFASKDPRVREAACHAFALHHEGEKLALPQLEKCLSDPDKAVAAAAKRTLAGIAERAAK